MQKKHSLLSLGIAIILAYALILTELKILQIITWHWYIVLLPVWIVPVLTLLIAAVIRSLRGLATLYTFLSNVYKNRNDLYVKRP